MRSWSTLSNVAGPASGAPKVQVPPAFVENHADLILATAKPACMATKASRLV